MSPDLQAVPGHQVAQEIPDHQVCAVLLEPLESQDRLELLEFVDQTVNLEPQESQGHKDKLGQEELQAQQVALDKWVHQVNQVELDFLVLTVCPDGPEPPV